MMNDNGKGNCDAMWSRGKPGTISFATGAM